jgi:hypothetical protein
MAQIAPLLLSLILMFGYATAGALAVYALLPGPGWRWLRVAIVPAAAAIIFLVVLLTALRGPSADLVAELSHGGLPAGQWRVSDWTARALLAMTILSALLGVYLLAHALPHAAARWRMWRRRTRRSVIVDVVRAGLLAGLLVAFVAGSTAVGTFVAQGRQVSTSSLLVATHALAGTPTGIAVAGDGTGFLTYGEGQIVRYSISPDGRTFEAEVVAEGLSFPRGPLILAGELLVVDLTQTACAQPFPQCFTGEPAEELRRIDDSSGRVLAFPIADDGSLGAPRELLTGLPIVNTSHAPNSLSLGPDGAVYLPIGGPDYLVLAPELLDDIGHPRAELLGTLVRLRPGDTDIETVANGLRNVYAVTFDPSGRILGVDNDGPTVRGWHHEQLVEIVDGADYGYPEVGSFDPDVPPPLWIVGATASAGITWFESAERPGILTGSSGKVLYIPVVSDADGLYVPNRQQVREVVTGLGGFATAIAPMGSDLYAVTVFDPSGTRNALLVIEITAAGV